MAKEVMGKSKSTNFPSLLCDGDLKSSDLEKAEAFNEYFVGISKSLDESETSIPNDPPPKRGLSWMIFRSQRKM
jgi:hypothetical protein